MVEWLNVHRAARFIHYALEKDLQLTIARREAGSLLVRSLAEMNEDSLLVIEVSAELFDKLRAFCAQNDLQVHQNQGNLISVYAIVRQLGELRRILRDHPARPLLTGNFARTGAEASSPPLKRSDSRQFEEGEGFNTPFPTVPPEDPERGT